MLVCCPIAQQRFARLIKMSQLPLAPRVLIKEATAGVEIFVIAGWQGGPFVLGKPLRESDHAVVGGVGRPDVGRFGSGQPPCLRSSNRWCGAFLVLRGRRFLGVAAKVVAAACSAERLLRPTLERLRLVR